MHPGLIDKLMPRYFVAPLDLFARLLKERPRGFLTSSFDAVKLPDGLHVIDDSFIRS